MIPLDWVSSVVVVSAFRDASAHVDRWLQLVAALRDFSAPHPVRAIAVEGDSRDRTFDRLVQGAVRHNVDLHVTVHNHGGPVYGSTEQPERMRALSGVCNAALDTVSRLPASVVLYVESDLIWTPETAWSLIYQLRRAGGPDEGIGRWDVVAPLVFAGTAFYDIWAYRLNGTRFSPFAPYHPDIPTPPTTTAVDSAGSCLVMRGDVARSVRIRDGGALVEWCHNARAQGYRIAVDPNQHILHP